MAASISLGVEGSLKTLPYIHLTLVNGICLENHPFR